MAFSQLRRLRRRRRFTANLAVFPQAAEGFLIFYSCHLKRVTEARREERGRETEPNTITHIFDSLWSPRGVCVLFAFMPNSAHILRGPLSHFTFFSLWPQTKRNEQLMRVKMLPQLALPDSQSLCLSLWRVWRVGVATRGQNTRTPKQICWQSSEAKLISVISVK